MMDNTNHNMVHTFERKIEDAISRRDLLCRDGFYVVALSGGPDSVALLRVLVSLGYTVHAAHCNFHLRGEESNRDEKFCETLCKKMGIELHRIHFDTAGYAKLHQVSIEMAARTLRYSYFEQLCKDIAARGICVAHHSDDQVETILLNLVRGTGLRGLQGMRWRNGNILRPLLGVTRNDVMQYLEAVGQDYVTDHTNLEDAVQRNKLRLNIIPQLEKINPAVKENVLRMAEHLGEADAIIQQALHDQAEKVCNPTTTEGVSLNIDLRLLHQQPSPEHLLWHLLSPYGFRRTQVGEIVDNQTNGNMWLADKWVAFIDREHLLVINKDEWGIATPAMHIPECGTYVLRQGNHERRFSFQQTEGPMEPSRHPHTVTLDADNVAFPLTLRPVEAGDRFVPFGMKHSKLVSDFLTDQKVSVIERRQQLVLVDAAGAIVWVVGRRVDDRVALNKNTTQRVLTIKWM